MRLSKSPGGRGDRSNFQHIPKDTALTVYVTVTSEMHFEASKCIWLRPDAFGSRSALFGVCKQHHQRYGDECAVYIRNTY